MDVEKFPKPKTPEEIEAINKTRKQYYNEDDLKYVRKNKMEALHGEAEKENLLEHGGDKTDPDNDDKIRSAKYEKEKEAHRKNRPKGPFPRKIRQQG